jgi:hypothetical protein
MPRVHSPSQADILRHPREYALLRQAQLDAAGELDVAVSCSDS